MGEPRGDRIGSDDPREAGLTVGAGTSVFRSGGLIHREQGENAETVHRLLLHLEHVGFDGAPRFVGIDAQEREVLTFVEGDCVPYTRRSDIEDLAFRGIGALIRGLHDAAVDFGEAPLPRGWIWGHGDISPSNIVFRSGVAVALIDFDYARPMPVEREVAWAAWQSVPLADRESLSAMGFATAPDWRARLSALLDGYGYPTELRTQFAAAAAAAAHECAVNISPGMVLPDRPEPASPAAACLRQSAWILQYQDEINNVTAGAS